jgi:hypothetical protein
MSASGPSNPLKLAVGRGLAVKPLGRLEKCRREVFPTGNVIGTSEMGRIQCLRQTSHGREIGQ